MHQDRKNEHVQLAERLYHLGTNSFDDLRFVHHSLPQQKLSNIDLSTQIGPIELNTPFYINAMTGGSKQTKEVNEALAIVARETGIAIASGSMSVALKDPSVIDSFTILRKINPRGTILANLGAGKNLEDAKRVVDLLEASALQIHINAPQELIMPEGDRDFTLWLENISSIVNGIDVPVIVKEVGFGMSTETISILYDVGVRVIDVSGRGGTNFTHIENSRRTDQAYRYLMDWGQTTVVSLLEASPYLNKIDVIASGGIRNPLDIVKSLALGAKAVGVAGYFLHLLRSNGVEELIKEIQNWQDQLKTLFTLLGKANIKEIVETDLLVLGATREWCIARGIDPTFSVKRS